MQRADPHFFVRTQIVIQIKRSEFCPAHGALVWRVVQVLLGHCITVYLVSGFRMACRLRCVPRWLRYVFCRPLRCLRLEVWLPFPVGVAPPGNAVNLVRAVPCQRPAGAGVGRMSP